MEPRLAKNESPNLVVLEGSFDNIYKSSKFIKKFGGSKNYSSTLSIRITGVVTPHRENLFWEEGVSNTKPKVTLPLPPRNYPDTTREAATNIRTFNRKILTEQLDTDTELVAGDGFKMGCHNIFLAGNSVVFQKMLEGSLSAEGPKKTVTLEDLTGPGVKALLAYLYCSDVEKAGKDSRLCLELLQAAVKYKIGKLQEKMSQIILSKPDAWFQEDTTIHLFLYSRKGQDCSKLKTKVVRLLKSKFPQLQTSASYRQLLIKDEKVAVEMCKLVVS